MFERKRKWILPIVSKMIAVSCIKFRLSLGALEKEKRFDSFELAPQLEMLVAIGNETSSLFPPISMYDPAIMYIPTLHTA